MKLKELEFGEKAVITKVKGRGAFRKRIMEMGFVAGREIEAIKEAPFKDPKEYRIMNYEVMLRNGEAGMVEVVSESEAKKMQNGTFSGMIDEKLLKTTAEKKKKEINVVLIGNPNCGKTTVFNFASHSKERVGNYCGVTVESKEAQFKQDGYTFHITDLPGTYSMTAYSPEEIYVRRFIQENAPDVVVNVIESSNLERNLYLTTELIDMDIKVVAALNMYDELEKKADIFDHEKLGKMIGIPFVPTVASKGKGIKELFKKIIDVYEDRDKTVRHVHINYGLSVENSIKQIQDNIYRHCPDSLTDRISSRFLALKLLEKDTAAAETILECAGKQKLAEIVKDEIETLEADTKLESETVITDAKYGFIAGALKETYKPGARRKHSKTEIIDNIVTHKIWGLPIFLFFMWLTFYSTFTLGEYPMQWIEFGVDRTAAFFSLLLGEGMLKDFFVNGIIGGLGGVLVFLPNIIMLYLFISLMEDTGYMARAVFIMDKAMHTIGLHGKSFIPLLMGFGCNVPAIMSSRIIESRRDRLLTMLINPFMSCSARLPVYVLFISAFFVHYQSLILFGIYLTGVLLAILSAILFKKTLFKTQDIPFVMELPRYRMPTLRSILKHMWFRASQYLKKIGGVILAASVIIWALGYFPRNVEYSRNYEQDANQIEQMYNEKIALADKNNIEGIKHLRQEKESRLHRIELAKKYEEQENSYIGRIGGFIQPVMAPLGFDWKMTVSIITGIAAKEVIVGTMGVLYEAEDEDDAASLTKKLRSQRYHSGEKAGQKVFTPLIALSFMLFILIYFPCVAVISAIKKESGGWKWAMFSVGYTTVLAWTVSFMVYQLGSLLM